MERRKMNHRLVTNTLPRLLLVAGIFSSLPAFAKTCFIANNDPYSMAEHASPQVELSDLKSISENRVVTFSSGLQVEVTRTSDSGGQVVYQSIDSQQPVRVTVYQVGNVERDATVTVGLVLPLNYSCQ